MQPTKRQILADALISSILEQNPDLTVTVWDWGDYLIENSRDKKAIVDTLEGPQLILIYNGEQKLGFIETNFGEKVHVNDTVQDHSGTPVIREILQRTGDAYRENKIKILYPETA